MSDNDIYIVTDDDLTAKADLEDGKVPESQLPSYVDDVVEVDGVFPAEGESGKIYVDKTTNKTYRWTGEQYVMVGGDDPPVLSVNGKTGAVVLSAADVGAVQPAALSAYRMAVAQDAIDNVQTGRLNELEPAVASSLRGLDAMDRNKVNAASLASEFYEGSTYAVGDYCTKFGWLYKCTTAVTTAGAWNDANWSAVAVTDEMGDLAPLASPAFTGTPTAPTANAGTSTTQIATTAFVQAALASLATAGIVVDNVRYKLVKDVQVTSVPALAQAVGLTPSDDTTMSQIQTALNLADTNTVQDAIDAVS